MRYSMRFQAPVALVALIAFVTACESVAQTAAKEDNEKAPAEREEQTADIRRHTFMREFEREAGLALKQKDERERARRVAVAVRKALVHVRQDTIDSRLRVALLERIERVHWRLGNEADAKKASEQRYQLLKAEGVLTPEQLVKLWMRDGERYGRLGYGTAARHYFEQVIKDAPSDPAAARAAMWIGMLLVKDGQVAAARDHYARMAKLFERVNPDAMRQALFRQADCEEKLGNLEAARAVYHRLVEKHPETQEAEDARHRLKEMESPETIRQP